MKFLKKHLVTILLVIILLVGIGLLLYPTVSDYWNSLHQSRAIASYAEAVANLDDETYEKILNEAIAYNDALAQSGALWNMTDEQLEEYNNTLDITGTGIMGYIEIQKIGVSLPIYHGTDEGVLQIAIGHLEGSSLPVASESYHAVLSGHRGLPSAKLFTDLDQIVEGDEFVVRVLDETYTYQVDQILVVLPEQMSSLNIEQGKQYCTLVTCTPYGVNTHRMLVRGHLIDNDELSESIRVTADALQVDETMVAPFIAVPFVIVVVIILVVVHHRNKKYIRYVKSLKKEAYNRLNPTDQTGET